MNVDYNPWSVQKMNLNRELNIMEPLAELDGSMEPLQRARSNTWPLPRPDDYVEPDGGNGGNGGGGGIIGNKCPVGGLGVPPPSCIGGAGGGGSSSAAAKKNSSRRNAWGNFSYADLITQAITSSQDKRLTLSQIYEWMVQNVDYFKDKGDSNSSAGWKNSIRHNLSLHNRFMRVQNEGTGKSSWWMINPDAKPGKSVRRRAASMETSKFEKRRGRVKKKISDMRNGLTEATPSPSSSVSEGLDQFPDSPLPSGAGFQLSPDFRPRASSNTSSCGRLSPIHSVDVEPDWNTPNPYSTGATGGANTNGPSNYSPEMGGNYSPDQLAGNLEQGMKLQPEAYLGYMNGQTQQPPPPYSAPYESFNRRDQITSLHGSSPYGITQCPIHRLQNCGCGPVQCKVELMSPGGMSPSYPQSEPSPDPLSSQYHHTSNAMPRPPSSSPPLTPQPTGMTPSSVMLISGALNRPMISTAITSSMTLDDLNINIESLQGGFDCNVDEVIKHELNMDGSLDFNFSSNHQILNQTTDSVTMVNNTQTVAPPAYSTTVTTPSWVH